MAFTQSLLWARMRLSVQPLSSSCTQCHGDKLDKVSGDIFKERPQRQQRHTEEHQKQESGMGMGAGWTRRSEVSILLKT